MKSNVTTFWRLNIDWKRLKNVKLEQGHKKQAVRAQNSNR